MRTCAYRICGVAVFMAASSFSQASSREDQAIDEISVYRTPGKPHHEDRKGEPGEQITAKHEGERYVLIVSNNLGMFHEEKVSLDIEDWRELIAVVRREKLLDFRPQMNEGVVYDFGVVGFRIKAEQLVTQEWTKDIRNGRRPTVLFQRLAKLAQQKVPQLHLHYLPPELSL